MSPEDKQAVKRCLLSIATVEDKVKSFWMTLHKDLPQTVISDIGDIPKNFRSGYASGSVWYNCGRYLAYNLSPYDETLLLDTDYIVNSNKLLKTFSFSDYQI